MNEFLQSANQYLGLQLQLTDVSCFHFCNDEINANYCAQLVVNKIKTATCSLACWYDEMLEPEAKIGDYWLVTNWYNKPLALVMVTDSYRCLFKNVSHEFAYKEGEGDRSLDYWCKEHKRFFENDAAKIGITFNPDMELSLQEFTMVFSE